MNSTVQNVQLYLQSLELVDGSSGWSSTRRRSHDEAGDQLVVITEDGGGRPELTGPPGSMGDVALKDPAVQIRVRAKAHDSDAAFEKAQAIMDALHGLNGVTLGDRYYLRVAAQNSEPIFIGFDAKNRPEYTLSFRLATGVVVESA